MLADDSPLVCAELARRSSLQSKSSEKASWKDQHSNLAEQYGVKWPLEIPPELDDAPWFHVLPAREKEAALLILKPICSAMKRAIIKQIRQEVQYEHSVYWHRLFWMK